MKFLILLFSLFVSFQNTVQKKINASFPKKEIDYPKNYFQSPVGGDIHLNGTFGELRPNHFHAGIDIRHKPSSTNEPIFAAAEGYIARIKIQGGGYGQAIYIVHPNGFTTVYGHLEKFIPDVQKFVRDKQYADQLFEQDIQFDSTKFRVTKGMQIANMGNRGNSFGEHLHFEIRETATEKTINPLLFGFKLTDNTAPTLGGLKLYEFSGDNAQDERAVVLKKNGNNYAPIASDTLETASEKIGFAINTNDASEESGGHNGIFSIRVLRDSQTIYKFTTESVAFSESRFVNAHMDYEAHATSGKYYHRTFLLPGNFLQMYDSIVDRGLMSVSEKPTQLFIEVSDVNGNTSRLKFFVKRNFNLPSKQILKPITNYFLPFNEVSIINFNAAKLRFPANALYESLNLRLGLSDIENNQLSPTYQIHSPSTPLHSEFEIAISPTVFIPDSMKPKVILAYCTNTNGRVTNLGGNFRADNYFVGSNDDFGNYCLKYDTVAPTIRNITSKKTKKTNRTRLSFLMKDNFGIGNSETALKYTATADGVFFLLEFDAKNNLLFYNLNENRVALGEHVVEVTVKDYSGNTAVLKEKISF